MLVNTYPRLHKVSFNCKRELFDYNGRRKFSVAIVALRSCGGGREGHSYRWSHEGVQAKPTSATATLSNKNVTSCVNLKSFLDYLKSFGLQNVL